MKIAIFGDSFSDPTWCKRTDYKAWPELLGEKYSIDNYSHSGSSMWWSYKKFLDNQSKYDKIIFTVTVPGRIHVEYNDTHINLNPTTWPVWNGIPVGEVYFRYFYSLDREEAFHNFMLNDLMNRKNVLLIPSFEESIKEKPGVSLCFIADKETDFFGLAHTGPNEKRKCHMSVENNLMVYNTVVSAIENNDKILDIKEDNFKEPQNNMQFYWG